MPSEDSIFCGQRSPAGGQGDIPTPRPRTNAAPKGGHRQCAPKDQLPKIRPIIEFALDTMAAVHAQRSNPSKLYSELPRRKAKGSVEFHVDSIAQPPILTGYEMPVTGGTGGNFLPEAPG